MAHLKHTVSDIFYEQGHDRAARTGNLSKADAEVARCCSSERNIEEVSFASVTCWVASYFVIMVSCGITLTAIALMGSILFHPLGKEERHRVVIVGAGVSGFAAATFLLANNFSDFIILEASDRIGGRIHTVEFGGVPIEEGAEFIHGEQDNIVYEMASPYKILATYWPYELIASVKKLFPDPTGRKYDSTYVNTLLIQAREILNKVSKDFNGSVADYFYPRFKELLEAEHVGPELSEAVTHLQTQIEESYTSADSLQQIGLLEEQDYVQNEGDQRWKFKYRGYKTIFDILSRKFPNSSEEFPVMDMISFGKEVQTVRLEDSAGEVVVRSVDGTRYRADHVLITVSLGVLKKHAQDMFHPPLPQNKTDAIRTLGFGCVGKVFLLFPNKWWPDDINAVVPLFSQKQLEDFKKNSKHGYWTAYTSGIYPVMNHDRMLCAWYPGQSCRTMELLTIEEVIEGHLELLNTMVGKQFQIPRPESVHRSSWIHNPHTYGTYTFHTVESDRLNVTMKDLSEPLWHGDKPVVLFAGEATHPHYWSTVHGALSSGRREAANLLEYFKTQS